MDEFTIRLVQSVVGFLVGLLVLITLIAAISSTRTDHGVDRLSECNPRVTADLVRAAHEWTGFTEDSSLRTWSFSGPRTGPHHPQHLRHGRTAACSDPGCAGTLRAGPERVRADPGEGPEVAADVPVPDQPGHRPLPVYAKRPPAGSTGGRCQRGGLAQVELAGLDAVEERTPRGQGDGEHPRFRVLGVTHTDVRGGRANLDTVGAVGGVAGLAPVGNLSANVAHDMIPSIMLPAASLKRWALSVGGSATWRVLSYRISSLRTSVTSVTTVSSINVSTLAIVPSCGSWYVYSEKLLFGTVKASIFASTGRTRTTMWSLASKRSEVLAASAAADAKIPHKYVGEDDASKGREVRPASVAALAKYKPEHASSTVATDALPPGCKMPTNLPKNAPAWTCFLGAEAAKKISAKVAKARGITITPQAQHCEPKGCWNKASAYQSWYSAGVGYFWGTRLLGTVDLYADIDLVNGQTAQTKPLWYTNNRAASQMVMIGDRMYLSKDCPAGCRIAGQAKVVGPRSTSAGARYDWPGSIGYRSLGNVALGTQYHEVRWQHPSYPRGSSTPSSSRS